MTRVDLNGDAGENPRALTDGTEAKFLGSLTSASIACGGHAGDDGSMAATVALCRRLGVSVGAHPSYPDRAAFGRRSMSLSPAAIEDEVYRQVAALGAIARDQAMALRHLKPHGALYHDCAAGSAVAEAVGRAAARFSRELVLVAAANCDALDAWRSSGFTVVAEAFADRTYEPDGALRSREHGDALILDPALAAAQALRIVVDGEVVATDGSILPIRADSICVHGDTPGAAAIARAVRAAVESRVAVRSFASPPC